MFQIKLANRIVRIRNHYDFVEKLCRDYLTDHTQPFDMEIQIPPETIEAEQQLAEGKYSPGYCESICVYREISLQMLEFQTMVMHMAVISCDGQGIGFAAKSGTGKSTHIALWKKCFGERVKVINGDKPLLSYEKSAKAFFAHGTPWCGKEGWNCNESAKLTKICFLVRGEKNSIRKMQESEVLDRLFHQLLVAEQEQALLLQMDLIELLLERVSFYELTCNISGEAAETAYKGLFNKD